MSEVGSDKQHTGGGETPRTRICLALTEASIAEDLRLLEANRASVDLVELRADFLAPSEYEHLAAFARHARVPAILTVRRERDGGNFSGSEEDRFALIERALSGDWSYVDLEEDAASGSVERHARSRGARIIRSFHAKDAFPARLAERVRALPRRPDELPKAAVLVQSTHELALLLDAYDELADLEKILIGMGSFGFVTRVLAGRLGSALSYCTAGERSAAPGHVDPRTLAELYRVRSVGARTALYSVIGNPIMHSRSPSIHNAGYAALGLDAVYVPLQVDDLAQFFAIADRLGIRGSSVTIPHKERVLRYLTERDEAARRIGSCNTIVRTASGWRGANTDAVGFLAPLVRALARASGRSSSAVAAPGDPRSREAGGELNAAAAALLGGTRALVVGAGGAARAVVFALTAAGCDVTIVNRTADRARLLAGEFGCACEELSAGGLRRAEERSEHPFDLIVQTTSVGMHPHEGDDPLPFYEFTGSELVYELIYAPERTRLLERALEAGCRTIGGFEMLLAQAYAQFELFTGQQFPRERARIGGA